MILIELFISFLKIGATTFGGGYAMLPIIQAEIEEKRKWCTSEELMDYFAIGQCTPGTIAMNVSTFVGYKKAGILGALVACISFIFVPLLLIIFITALLSNFAQLEIVKHAFGGIRVCVCVLIIQAILRLWSKAIVDYKTLIAFLIIFLLSAFGDYFGLSISLVVYVILAGTWGYFWGPYKEEK